MKALDVLRECMDEPAAKVAYYQGIFAKHPQARDGAMGGNYNEVLFKAAALERIAKEVEAAQAWATLRDSKAPWCDVDDAKEALLYRIRTLDEEPHQEGEEKP